MFADAFLTHYLFKTISFRPNREAASYFIQMGQLLSTENTDVQQQLPSTENTDVEQQKIKKIPKKICSTLGLNEAQLNLCKQTPDITKTCRAVVKEMYPDKAERAEQSVVRMGKKKVAAIRGKYEVTCHISMAIVRC